MANRLEVQLARRRVDPQIHLPSPARERVRNVNGVASLLLGAINRVESYEVAVHHLLERLGLGTFGRATAG